MTEEIKNQLMALGVTEEDIQKEIEARKKYNYNPSVAPQEFGDGPLENLSYHWRGGYICYCPQCQKLQVTNRSGCMCGFCLTCDYSWSCNPPNLSKIIIGVSGPRIQTDGVVMPYGGFLKAYKAVFSDGEDYQI